MRKCDNHRNFWATTSIITASLPERRAIQYVRKYSFVPVWGQSAVTLERSRKLVRLNQVTATLGCLGVLGLCAFVGKPSEAPAASSNVDLAALRHEVARLTEENRLMNSRVQEFRREFNGLQTDFSSFSVDLSNLSEQRRVSGSDLESALGFTTDLGFTLINLESNLQYLEKRVKASDPKILNDEVASLLKKHPIHEKLASR